MPAKLKLEVVQQRLKDRNIEMIGEYTHSHVKYEFVCGEEECRWHWKTKLNAIFNGTGCPMCAGRAIVSNADLDAIVFGTGIKRIGNYTNNHTLIDWQHEECGEIWKRTPKNIKKGLLDCPICIGTKLSNTVVDRLLIGRNIKRLDDFISTKLAIRWQCLLTECLYIWSAVPGSILYHETGCPQCSGKLKLTDADVDLRLEGRNIKRLGHYIDAFTKIDWECLLCMHIWFARPTDVLNGGHGCTRCPIGKSERMVGVLLEEYGILHHTQKPLKELVVSETRNLRVDYYLPEYNTIIEYNGEQHYSPVQFHGMSKEEAEEKCIKQKERDAYKQQVCDLANIQIIWIDGREYMYHRLSQYLKEVLIPMVLKPRTDER